VKRTLSTLLVFGTLGAAAACGQLKGRPDNLAVLQQGAAPGVSGASGADSSGGTSTADVQQIKEFLDLYFPDGKLTKSGVNNLLTKYQDKILPLLEGMGISQQDLVNILFSFSTSGDGTLTAHDVADGLAQRIPILKWIPDNSSEIDAATLRAQVAAYYPTASAAATTSLAGALMRYDAPWAGGDGDGKISRQELTTAGLILALIGQTDFSHGVQISAPDGGSAADAQTLALVDQKMNEQLFPRYGVTSYKQLAPADVQVEFMTMSLRFALIDKLAHAYSDAGLMTAAQTRGAMTAWYAPGAAPVVTDLLVRFYDGQLAGGDGDGFISSLEAFNLVTDLDFSYGVHTYLNGDYSWAHVSSFPGRNALLGDLIGLFPSAGQSLYTTGAYWDGLKSYDAANVGGTADGKVEPGEFAMSLSVARAIDVLYGKYATSKPGVLTKDEGRQLFANELKITDKRIVDAFFADVGLNGKGSKFFLSLKAFFSGKLFKETLTPFEFHQRLLEYLPTLLSKPNGPTSVEVQEDT
jgi:hypothetical protein